MASIPDTPTQRLAVLEHLRLALTSREMSWIGKEESVDHDAILDRLDIVWDQMSDRGQTLVRRISSLLNEWERS